MVFEGKQRGVFDETEEQLIRSVFDFADSTVRRAMIPRTDMVAVPHTISFHELAETFAVTHKSRIPVYQETVDRVIGLVHVKSLVKHLIRDHEPPIEDLMRDCPVVPESKQLGELLLSESPVLTDFTEILAQISHDHTPDAFWSHGTGWSS